MRRAFRQLLFFAVAAPLLAAFLAPAHTTPTAITHTIARFANASIPPLTLACTTSVLPAQSTEVLIAAAADLKFAMDSIVTVFSKQNPNITVKVVYGSSGNFFQQIDNSAPFDLFFSP